MRNAKRVIEQLSVEEAEIRDEVDRKIAEIRENAAAALKAKRDARKTAEKVLAREAGDRLASMAFALGEFLLRNGEDDGVVRAIVNSEEFDAFTRPKRRAKARRLFRLAAIDETVG